VEAIKVRLSAEGQEVDFELHDDFTLKRFLRARGGDVDKAYEMFVASLISSPFLFLCVSFALCSFFLLASSLSLSACSVQCAYGGTPCSVEGACRLSCCDVFGCSFTRRTNGERNTRWTPSLRRLHETTRTLISSSSTGPVCALSVPYPLVALTDDTDSFSLLLRARSHVQN
jgi:hypothetical protein